MHNGLQKNNASNNSTWQQNSNTLEKFNYISGSLHLQRYKISSNLPNSTSFFHMLYKIIFRDKTARPSLRFRKKSSFLFHCVSQKEYFSRKSWRYLSLHMVGCIAVVKRKNIQLFALACANYCHYLRQPLPLRLLPFVGIFFDPTFAKHCRIINVFWLLILSLVGFFQRQISP